MSGPRGTDLRLEFVESDGFLLAILQSKDRGVFGRLSLLISLLAAPGTSLRPGARDWIIASSFATLSLRLSLLSTAKF